MENDGARRGFGIGLEESENAAAQFGANCRIGP